MGIYKKQTLKISALVSLSILLASCTDPSIVPPPPPEAPTEFEANISTIFTDNCVNCHTDDNVGTFSLVPAENGWENAVMQSDAIAATVMNNTMPPFLANNSGQCNNFSNEFSMSQADIDSVTTWVTNGTPADATGTVKMIIPSLTSLAPEDVSQTIAMKEGYTPKGIGGTDNEDNRCFVIDGLAESKILTAFEVVPGDTRNVHHVQLYLANTNNTEINTLLSGWENEEPEPGYSCYGDSRLETTASLIASWTPGTGAISYPNNTGIRINMGSKFIMQVHYLVKQSTAAKPDLTKIKLKLANIGSAGIVEANILTVTNESSSLILAAGQQDVTFLASARYGLPYDAKIHAIMPHMHDMGTRIKVQIQPAGNATPQCLIDIPLWSFEWQRYFFYKAPTTPITIKAEDVGNSIVADTISIECGFNTLQSSNDVIHGHEKGQEHCMAHLYIVPIL